MTPAFIPPTAASSFTPATLARRSCRTRRLALPPRTPAAARRILFTPLCTHSSDSSPPASPSPPPAAASDAASGPPPLTPSASSSPAPPPAQSAPPSTAGDSATPSQTFLHKFDSLRGADIEPVSASVQRFSDSFRRPVPVIYRAVVNETITTTHLARVCAMWRFDSVFAYGFDAIFSNFLRFYPDADERDQLYRCVAESLLFDVDIIKSTAAKVADWTDGKSEQDVLDALSAAPPGATSDTVGPVIEALAFIRDSQDFEWYYSRLFGLGLIQIMTEVGADLTAENAEKWAEAIGLQKSKFSAEMGNFLSGMERLKQAEQIFAEATTREAKKTAERLAARAKKAAEEADKLEKGADEAGASTTAEETAASADNASEDESSKESSS